MRELVASKENESAEESAARLGIKLLSLEEAQNEMNTKLLSGWTMLNETCPISKYPLIRNKETGEVWSVRCQMRVQDNSSNYNGKSLGEVDSEKRYENGPEEPTGNFEEKSKRSINDISKVIADKLLIGWTMLEDQCPYSACPLMLDPNTNRKWSAGLRDYVDNYNKETSTIETPVVESKTMPESKPNKSANETKPYLKQRQESDTDIQSKRIGQKLLLGWTMLEDICPVTERCPLLRDREGRLWSAALNDYIPDDTLKNKSNNAVEKDVYQSDRNRISENNQLEKKKRQQEDELQTQRMAEKLLQGWTMLEQICPVTESCPLFRNPRNGKLWSPALNDYIPEQSPSQPQTQQQVHILRQNRSSALTTTASMPDEAQDKVKNHNRNEANYDEGDSSPDGLVEDQEKFWIGSWKEQAKKSAMGDIDFLERSEDKVADNNEISSTRTVQSGVSVNRNLNDELERANAVILSKMAECNRVLTSYEVSPKCTEAHIATIRSLIELLGSCGEALQKLQLKSL